MKCTSEPTDLLSGVSKPNALSWLHNFHQFNIQKSCFKPCSKKTKLRSTLDSPHISDWCSYLALPQQKYTIET